ncbi:aminotransferas-like protein [Choiromyces venosus 120613-1]|uniref:Aminotransferas-like protein n=1 Tax=Choiromyces venosus 120613-1 TaxID=1336337 RepID=A0A3N4JGI9_9PEZI|nr:aminotransferas-like protein [Choiromyces venosus 120613-1]
MVQIKPFNVEQWMDKYETTATHNLAESCSDSLSLNALLSLGGHTLSNLPFPFSSIPLTYGHIRGSPEFRQNVAALYPPQSSNDGLLPALPAENVLITPGAIAANFLVFYTLVGAGDHVIVMTPTYQQLHSVPASLGAEVEEWKLRPEEGFKADVEVLREMVRKPGSDGKGGTKLIVITNPNNPTGVIHPTAALKEIVSIAQSCGNVPILSDEVYRPLFHNPDIPAPASILDIYSHGIATGSLSKAYALAGIRVGWVAARQSRVIQACATARDYNTICVSMLDDAVAAYALSKGIVEKLLERNVALCKRNWSIVDRFFGSGGGIDGVRFKTSYTRSSGGTILFVRLTDRDGVPIDDKSFCHDLHTRTGVLLVPGGFCFGSEFKGYLRMGYACNTKVLEEGLEKIRNFLKEF